MIYISRRRTEKLGSGMCYFYLNTLQCLVEVVDHNELSRPVYTTGGPINASPPGKNLPAQPELFCLEYPARVLRKQPAINSVKISIIKIININEYDTQMHSCHADAFREESRADPRQ